MNPLRRNHRIKRCERSCVAGFTLIELMIVMTIIFILLGIAAMRYDKSVLRAHEAVLHQDLQALRQSIDNYTLDRKLRHNRLKISRVPAISTLFQPIR